MSEISNHLSDITEGESLTFSAEQIEYLRKNSKDSDAGLIYCLLEKNCIGRTRTHSKFTELPSRTFPDLVSKKIEKMLKSRNNKIVYFVQEDEESKEEELFPSALLITPELLPTSSASRKADSLIEEILIAVRRGSVSVNAIRDTFSEGSFSMSKEEQTKAAFVIMDHMFSSCAIRSVGEERIRRYFKVASNSNFGGHSFGENYIDKISDERGIRTLIQLHGKGGNFSRPINSSN